MQPKQWFIPETQSASHRADRQQALTQPQDFSCRLRRNESAVFIVGLLTHWFCMPAHQNEWGEDLLTLTTRQNTYIPWDISVVQTAVTADRLWSPPSYKSVQSQPVKWLWVEKPLQQADLYLTIIIIIWHHESKHTWSANQSHLLTLLSRRRPFKSRFTWRRRSLCYLTCHSGQDDIWSKC